MQHLNKSYLLLTNQIYLILRSITGVSVCVKNHSGCNLIKITLVQNLEVRGFSERGRKNVLFPGEIQNDTVMTLNIFGNLR